MFVVPCKWRELLPPEAQERFDDVNEQRVLGASSHIRIIGDIFLSIAENGADDPLPCSAASLTTLSQRAASPVRPSRMPLASCCAMCTAAAGQSLHRASGRA